MGVETAEMVTVTVITLGELMSLLTKLRGGIGYWNRIVGWDGGMGWWNGDVGISLLALLRKLACSAKQYGLIQL